MAVTTVTAVLLTGLLTAWAAPSATLSGELGSDPAPRFHDADVPLLEEVVLGGAGWAAWRVTVDEGATLEVEVEGETGGAFLGSMATWRILDDGRRAIVISTSFGVANHHLRVQLFDDEPLLDEGEGTLDVGEGLALTTPNLPAGTHTLITWMAAAGPLDGVVARAYAPADATLVASGSGPEAFLLHEPDFGGTANVIADDPTVHAKAVWEGAADRAVQGRLYGLFASQFGSHKFLQMSYDGPDGGGDGDVLYLLEGAPAGDYTFHVDQVAAGVGQESKGRVWVTGADVQLP